MKSSDVLSDVSAATADRGKTFHRPNSDGPHQDGPRRTRRKKNGGKMGVTRKMSTKRLEPADAIRHIQRHPDAVKRIRNAREVWLDLGRGPNAYELASYKSNRPTVFKGYSLTSVWRVQALSGSGTP